MELSPSVQDLSAGIPHLFQMNCLGLMAYVSRQEQLFFITKKNKGEKKREFLEHECETADRRLVAACCSARYFSQKFEENTVKIERNFAAKDPHLHEKQKRKPE